MLQSPKTFRMVYMDFGTTLIEEDSRFYTEVMSLSRDRETAADQVWLSQGYDRTNISFRKSEKSGLEAVGYQLARGVTIDDMTRTLSEAGLKHEVRSDARPGVERLIAVEPVGGHVIHLFEEIGTTSAGFSHHGISPLRLGHFAVISEAGEKIMQLYRDVLGFHHTDAFGDVVHFFTCNHEHHVLNVVTAPTPHRLHHLAFQLRDTGAHARAADVLAGDKKPIVWGPTRHTSGHNVASYFQDDSKRLVELYTDMDVYLPDLDMMEPRPWHEELPMRPRKWERGDVAYWKTSFAVELSKY